MEYPPSIPRFRRALEEPDGGGNNKRRKLSDRAASANGSVESEDAFDEDIVDPDEDPFSNVDLYAVYDPFQEQCLNRFLNSSPTSQPREQLTASSPEGRWPFVT